MQKGDVQLVQNRSFAGVVQPNNDEFVFCEMHGQYEEWEHTD